MDAETRRRLADALREATGETLRQDAHLMLSMVEVGIGGDYDEVVRAWKVAAGLMLAVAEMQERAVHSAERHPDWFVDEQDGAAAWIEEGNGDIARTLPAALADLLEGGR